MTKHIKDDILFKVKPKKEYFMRNLCERIGFPADAIDYLEPLYNSVTENPEYVASLDAAKEIFLTKFDSEEYHDYLQVVAEKSGIHRYTVDLIFLIYISPVLLEKYKEKGIDEKYYYDTMCDFTYKLMECRKLHGIWGNAALGWNRGFFRMQTTKVGRLEYQLREFPLDDYKDYIKKNDPVLSIHIPSSGPLCEDEVLDSIKEAYKFYGYTGNMVLFCQTWLLYPALFYDVCAENSNMAKFYNLFDVVKSSVYTDNSTYWRIFYVDGNTTPVDELPQETTLQKNLVKFFKAGNQLGHGAGVIVFDGEKIINK